MTTTSFDKDDRRSSLIRELLTYISQFSTVHDASSAVRGRLKDGERERLYEGARA